MNAPKRTGRANCSSDIGFDRRRQFPELAYRGQGKLLAGRSASRQGTTTRAGRWRKARSAMRHQAAQRIGAAKHVAAVCGREAQSTGPRRARRRHLPWTRSRHDVEEPNVEQRSRSRWPEALGSSGDHGVWNRQEEASSAHWGRTPREALANPAQLCDLFRSPRKKPQCRLSGPPPLHWRKIRTATPDNG